MGEIITTTTKPHLTQVDYIRAIASLSVVVFHLGGKVLPVLKYGWLGVQMFFLLSGFIICWAIPKNYTLRSSGIFILKRILRIEPPYIISICLVLLVNYISLNNYIVDWNNVMFHLAYLNSFTGKEYLNPVYWTLGIEFQFYLFIAFFYPIISHKYGPFVILSLCIISAFRIGPNLISFFPLFALGILFFQYKTKMLSMQVFICFCLLIAACGVITLGWLQTITASIALSILMLPLKANIIISFLSKISFSLYLTHDIVGSRTVVYLGTLWPKTILFKGVEFFVGFFVSILFSYFFYLLIEQPCLKASKRITYLKTL
nr:acyltransferase [Mucilaginibacter sp. L294]